MGNEIKEGGTYLFSRNTYLYEFSIIQISQKAVKVKDESGKIKWIEMEDFGKYIPYEYLYHPEESEPIDDGELINPPIREFSYVVGNPILKDGAYHFTNKSDIVNLKEQLEWWLNLLEENKGVSKA